jgi:putative hydrolase of the HAD superfamily
LDNDSGKIVRGVLFDAAGTIIRLVSPPGEHYSRWAGEHGYPVAAGEIQGAFPTAFEAMNARRLAGLKGRYPAGDDRDWWREVVHLSFILTGHPVPDIAFGPLYDLFAGEGVWDLYEEVTGVLELLRSSGLRLGVLSNFDERLEVILEDLGVRGFFDTVVFSSGTGTRKPDPAIFRLAAEGLGLEPEEIIHVGDSYAEDYLGAIQAGMKAVLLDRDERFAIRDRTVDLEGILSFVKGGVHVAHRN